jgi:beta-phosphoglucomutase-like phosphatase (HAD superfamily)
MTRTQAIGFDMDGVLIHSEITGQRGHWKTLWVEFLKNALPDGS